MQHLRNLFLLVTPLLLVSSSTAQRLDDTLATSTNITFTAASLSEQVQSLYLEQTKRIAGLRTAALDEMIATSVLELESRALNSTPDKLVGAKRKSVTAPTPAEIQKIYNANSAALGGRPLEEVRGEIVEYLKHEAEDRAIGSYIGTLRTKHKATVNRDVNAVGLRPADIVATIGTRTITLREFEEANKIRLNDAEMEIFEALRSNLEAVILSALATEEAKERKVDTSTYIATEVTDKLRQFTDEERITVQDALARRLFAKYSVKITLREPAPIVHNIAVEADDPQLGNPSAPVSVVMFTDLQCPACARTHPVLKQTLAEYGDKVRFVVRDFPLESIHAEAFQAALAANAARNQGKFFEYAEILYQNQKALDRSSLLRYVAQLGLNAKQFELDFSDARAAAEVRKDQADGRGHGVSSTPTVFVNGVKVHRLSADGFRRAIDRALSK